MDDVMLKPSYPGAIANPQYPHAFFFSDRCIVLGKRSEISTEGVCIVDRVSWFLNGFT